MHDGISHLLAVPTRRTARNCRPAAQGNLGKPEGPPPPSPPHPHPRPPLSHPFSRQGRQVADWRTRVTRLAQYSPVRLDWFSLVQFLQRIGWRGTQPYSVSDGAEPSRTTRDGGDAKRCRGEDLQQQICRSRGGAVPGPQQGGSRSAAAPPPPPQLWRPSRQLAVDDF